MAHRENLTKFAGALESLKLTPITMNETANECVPGTVPQTRIRDRCSAHRFWIYSNALELTVSQKSNFRRQLVVLQLDVSL